MTGPISLGESLQSIKQSNGRVYELYKNLEGFASLVYQRTQHDPRFRVFLLDVPLNQHGFNYAYSCVLFTVTYNSEPCYRLTTAHKKPHTSFSKFLDRLFLSFPPPLFTFLI